MMTSRNSSRSRECSDAQSQRSGKVVRANGLRMVQKPSIGKPHEQSPVNGVRLNEQSRRLMHRELELEAENKALKGQNQYLKQKLRTAEGTKNFEVKMLQQKIEYLLQMTQNLEKKMDSAESEWKEEVRKLRESQADDI